MRWGAALVVPAVLVAGCASTRRVAPSTPTVSRETPGIATRPAPAPPAPALGMQTHRRIDVWERRLRVRPELRRETEESLARGASYMSDLCAILAEYGLPSSLALLPVVESGFWPNAKGRADERGLWQLRRATARRFGLVVNGHRDDRVNPERATRGAARYLRFLRARYGDWPLALAAYNAGEHRVDRALARDPDADFWRLADHGALPRTSREYVPRFLAVVRMTELGVFASSRPGCGTVALKRVPSPTRQVAQAAVPRPGASEAPVPW